MHHFAYRDGVLHAEAVNLDTLAAAVGTPFYCYSTATLTRHYQVFAGAFADVRALVCYAMKANSNQAIITTLAKLGAGADVVSGGELKRARLAGIPPEKIMFSGIGKTASELASAVDEGILCVNVESEAELELLSSIASTKGRTARISIRVNPDIDAQTHHKIATGKAENKFGIPISGAREIYARAAKLKGLEVAGVDMHIGSQITELDPFGNAFALLAEFVRVLRSDGHNILHVDLGGGLGSGGLSLSVRLKALLPDWLPWIRKRYRLTAAVEKQLLRISARQIDRRLRAKKQAQRRRIYGRTKPGCLLKRQKWVRKCGGFMMPPKLPYSAFWPAERRMHGGWRS